MEDLRTEKRTGPFRKHPSAPGGVGTSFTYVVSGSGLYEMATATLGLLSLLNHPSLALSL